MSDVAFGSLNGYPLLSAKGTVDAFIAAGLPVAEWQDRVNSYRCPRGEEPGVATVLVTRKTLDAVKGESRLRLVLGCGAASIAIRDLLFVGADRLHDLGASDDETSPYLVTLADKRKTLRMTFVTQAYNVRGLGSPGEDYFDSTRKEDPPGTFADWMWATMFSDLWDKLPSGVASTAPELPFEPEGNPERFVFHAVSVWEAIHRLLDAIDCDTTYDPEKGTFSVVKVGDDDEGFDGLRESRRRDLYGDSESFQGGRATFPEAVKVCFPARHVGNGEEDAVVSPFHEIEYTAEDFGTATGVSLTTESWTKAAVHDPLEADMSDGPDADPVNLTALEDRSEEVGEAFYRSLCMGEKDGPRRRWVYRTLVPEFRPGKQVTEVVWRAGRGGATTTVMRYQRERRRRDTVTIPVDGWGFGKAATSLSPGELTAPDNEIDENKGPAWNSGAGEATGRTIKADWSEEEDEISVGEWVVWERKHGKVNVYRRNCASGA